MDDRSCNKPLEKDGETGHELQICKASSDKYLLEYVIESGNIHICSEEMKIYKERDIYFCFATFNDNVRSSEKCSPTEFEPLTFCISRQRQKGDH